MIENQKVKLPNPISYHWYGKFSLIITVLIILLALRSVFSFIPLLTNSIYVAALIVLSGAILIWQIVGAWRAVDISLTQNPNMLLIWSTYGAMVLCAGLTAVQTADWVSGLQDTKTITLASLRTRPLPKISDDGKTLFLDNEIDFELNNSFGYLLEQKNSISTVEIASDGGRIYAARAIANKIVAHGLNTRVTDRCNSACTIIFMAGKNRTLNETATLGFHRYNDHKIHPLKFQTVKDEQDKDIRFFKSRGLDDEFLKNLFQADHSSIWAPSRELLMSSGVLTSHNSAY